MKLTTPLKAFLGLTLLAGVADAASLSLGAGGLTTNHVDTPPLQTLEYTDLSGIVINYTKSPHSDFSSGGNSRGWSLDPHADVVGHQDVIAVVPEHLAMAHLTRADQVNINFQNATLVDLSTLTITVYDLDTNTGSTEFINVVDGAPFTITGSAGPLNGEAVTHPLTVGDHNQLVTLFANSSAAGYSSFTLNWDVIPEPSTGLLALVGGSLLFLRRRR